VSGVSELFDIQDARMRLQARRRELVAEISASRQLQQRFNDINQRMRKHLSTDQSNDDIEESIEDEADDLSMLYANTENGSEDDADARANDVEAEDDNNEIDDLDALDFDVEDMTPARFASEKKSKSSNQKKDAASSSKNNASSNRKGSKGNDDKKSRSARLSRSFVGVEDMVSST
jgi:hypothetical protein